MVINDYIDLMNTIKMFLLYVSIEQIFYVLNTLFCYCAKQNLHNNEMHKKIS